MKHWLFAVLVIAASNVYGAEKIQIIPPERLSNYWLLQSGSAAQTTVPNSGKNLDAPTCAAVSYVVEKDGSTSHVKVERVVPQGDLSKVALGAVSGMHFAPAAANMGKDAVYTYVVMSFNVPGAQSTNVDDKAVRARVSNACKLDDFTARKQP
ncbi:MAG TPA: hypothetical protein VHW73_11295 [Rudaea sp.]|jgi:hypothetical protein|nr:hypothetical protein [Rudaea sp.]